MYLHLLLVVFVLLKCTENVIWTVFQTPIVFSEPVLENFRVHIYLEDYRDLQVVNGRTVYRNFPNDTASSIPDYNCCGENDKNSNQSSNGNSILLINRQLSSYSFFLFLFFLIF
jgi:hypothetical protein